MHKSLGILLKFFSLCCLSLLFAAQTHASTLNIATIERPPFAMQNPNGEWTGFSIELIQEISERQNLNIQWQDQTVFADMLNAVANNAVDMAVANISVTADREKLMDFSQPIYASGLQIITTNKTGGVSFLTIILWFFERGEDAKHDYFRDEYLGGIWDAFWWAFIICTMGGFEKE